MTACWVIVHPAFKRDLGINNKQKHVASIFTFHPVWLLGRAPIGKSGAQPGIPQLTIEKFQNPILFVL